MAEPARAGQPAGSADPFRAPALLRLDRTSERDGLLLRSSSDEDGLAVRDAVSLTALGHPTETFSYDRLSETSAQGWRGEVTATLADGTRVAVSDLYRTDQDASVWVDRVVTVVAVGSAAGIRVGFSVQTMVEGATDEAWQYFIPGCLYNRNDSDGDGVEDYLGTYTQDYRDDRNGLLAVLGRHQRTGATFSLARATVPALDTALSAEQLDQRLFVQTTEIGSLGTYPTRDGQLGLRASFPFSEEYSFCLDMDRRGWAAFAPNAEGELATLRYRLRLTSTPDLTSAVWDLCESQREVLGTTVPTPPLTLDESVEYRQLLTQLYYRSWEPEENPREPAGYLVHFSPRTGTTLGSLIEFGFSGDQTLLAYVQLWWGRTKNVPLYVQRARKVIDFFVTHAQHANGFCEGIYDPLRDRFTQWFTGILMPFQYAADEADVRRYLGRQVAAALTSVAQELRTLEGNYLRSMCEAVYPVLLAYEIDETRPSAWLGAGQRFGEFLLANQAADGSWYRAYDPAGHGLTSPAAWFGASYAEQKSGTIFPIPVLTTLHRLSGSERYLDAARRAGDFVIDTFVDPVCYVGGLNDTTHVKSVKTDAVSVMFVMRSLVKLYRSTGEPRYLDGAVKAAKILSSFVYLWDVPMPAGTLLDRAGFMSTGWAGCDVIPGGSYLDNEFLEFTGDLIDVAALSGNESLFDIAELVEYGMQYGLSTPGNDHGYVAPGIQCEGVMTSYWLSSPDTTQFSGAVSKVKGDDNDTCNALTNGQAAYGVYDILRTYGTTDLTAVRAMIFPP